jgi:hypothetical protein
MLSRSQSPFRYEGLTHRDTSSESGQEEPQSRDDVLQWGQQEHRYPQDVSMTDMWRSYSMQSQSSSRSESLRHGDTSPESGQEEPQSHDNVLQRRLQEQQGASLREHHYPKDVKLEDMWSILHNYGTKQIDPEQHKKRLNAIAHKATGWIEKHGWDVSDDKKAALHGKILQYFNMPEKATAQLLFECVVRQDKKDNQSFLARAFHYAVINAIPLGHDKLQSAKKDLVRTFEAEEERHHRINRRKAEFNDLSWQKKIFNEGYKYGGKHGSEIKELKERIRSNESFQLKAAKIVVNIEKKTNKNNNKIDRWYKKYDEAESLSVEQQDAWKREGERLMHSIIVEALQDMDAHQQIAAAKSERDMNMFAGKIIRELQHQKHGVFANLGVHLFEQGPAMAALILATKAVSHGAA